jgi:hypothetical protein
MRQAPQCGCLPVQSTSLSRTAEHYAESHSFQVTPWCIDTGTTLRRDAFHAMTVALCSPPRRRSPCIPAGQDGEAGRGMVVGVGGMWNVETDAMRVHVGGGAENPWSTGEGHMPTGWRRVQVVMRRWRRFGGATMP